MSQGIADVQMSSLAVSNDATEQVVYAYQVAGGSQVETGRLQIAMAGSISSMAGSPGTLTIRLKLGSLTATVVNETLNAGIAASKFAANLEAWVRPDGLVGLSGLFTQNGADLFATPGARIASAAGAVDLTTLQTLTATVQFSTADPSNSFTRTLAALFVITG